MYQPCFFVGHIRGQVWLRGDKPRRKEHLENVSVSTAGPWGREALTRPVSTQEKGGRTAVGLQEICAETCGLGVRVSTAGAPTERWGLGKHSGKAVWALPSLPRVGHGRL